MVNEPQGHWCEALYEAKAADLLLYGRALGLTHCESEDVLQETFVALMALEAQPKQPVYYCLRTFRNRALNYRRGLWRRLTRELESVRWFERSEGETAEEYRAMKSLTQLPAEQREVIVLKFWHRHTFEEIGQLLDQSPNTVAGRYRYGIEKIRAALKADKHYELDPTREPFGFLETATPIGSH
jgi:RNA polymerase sigma-70 factor (ECF subfamily)